MGSAESYFYERQLRERMKDPVFAADFEAALDEIREDQRRGAAEAARLYQEGDMDGLVELANRDAEQLAEQALCEREDPSLGF